MNESTPLISIITITYNSGKTLEETIKSIISQDYPRLEYVIIDGGSKDNTLDIIHKYDESIAVVVSEPDKGISDAFNKGIRHSSGEIIGIINSDDILMPGTLTKIAKHYSKDIDVYSGNVAMWNDQADTFYVRKPDIVFDSIRKPYRAAHPARFIRKDAYEKYGMYSIELRYMMDVDLLYRFYKHGAVFTHIDDEFVKFRIGGTSSDNHSKKKNDFKVFVSNNGGSKFDFYYIWTKSWVRHICKMIFIKLSNKNIQNKAHSVLNR